MKTKFKNIFIEGAITPQKIAESIAHHSVKTEIRAHGFFLEQVGADNLEKGKVGAVECTDYEEMALKKSPEIRQVVLAKYQLTCMHIYQNPGQVKAGEICLVVFTSSGHPKVGIDACSVKVEQIKKNYPSGEMKLLIMLRPFKRLILN